MKKVLIALAVILLIVAVAAGVVFYKANQEVGLTESESVSHETLASPHTRVRAVLRTAALSDFIASLVPPTVKVPDYVPWDIQDALPRLLPREVALLADPDFTQGEIGLTLFANEQRLGPMLVKAVNDSGIFKKPLPVSWSGDGALLEKRGVITARANLPIPEGVESRILEHWTPQTQSEPVAVEGTNQFEIVLDNRNGDLVTLFAAISQAMKQDWKAMLNQDQVKSVLPLVAKVSDARLAANLDGPDTCNIKLVVHADQGAGGMLQFMLAGAAVPELQKMLEAKHSLILEGQSKYDKEQQALVGTYKLTGFREQLERAIAKAAGVSAPKQPKPEAAS